MKKKLLVSFVFCGLFVFQAFAADTMTMLEHRQEVNKLICQKKLECQEPIKLETCINAWNILAEVEVKETPVADITTLKSVKCRNYIRTKATCDNLTKIYTEGDCALSILSSE